MSASIITNLDPLLTSAIPLHVETGKHHGGPSLSLSTMGPACSLLEVKDMISGSTYLVDTGVEVSILQVSHSTAPPTTAPDLHSSDTPTLRAANGSPIKTYSWTCQCLHLSRHSLPALLLHANVDHPILGMDLLRHHRILVNIAGWCLLLPGWMASIPTITAAYECTSKEACNIL